MLDEVHGRIPGRPPTSKGSGVWRSG